MNARVSIAILALAGTLPPAVGQSPQSPPSPQESQKDAYLRQTFGLDAVGRSVAGASIRQMQGSPYEWGGGIKGFGKRLASGFGSHLVKHTIQLGVASVRHERMGYQRSQDQGFGPRLRHALAATVVTTRTDREGQTIAAGHITGVVGAGFISRLWHPARFHTIASGFSSAGLIFASDAGGNVLREFWPEIRHPRSGKRNTVPKSAVKNSNTAAMVNTAFEKP